MKNPIKNSISFKLIFVGFLVILLLIPATMVKGLIRERQYRSDEVTREISDKWGKQQTISGPVLSVPYQITYRDQNGKITETIQYQAHFLPEKLNITGDIKPEIRNRGIFEAILYTGDLKISGYFNPPNLDQFGATDVWWGSAHLSLGIPDMRGLKEVPTLKWLDEEHPLESGLAGVFDSGLGKKLEARRGIQHEFEIDLKINGSEQINFIPMGANTEVRLKSPWQNPSFNGSFLPDSHQITDNGFEATWKVLEVNRNFPQVWNNQSYNINEYKFGLKLIKPVNTYQQTERSVKYAILFILLSFLSYFLVEVLNRYQIHPIQYLLVGFAVVLFYLLLLSLSEHIAFNKAYLIASMGIVGMVSLYSAAILHKKKMGIILGIILSALYVYLYVLLQAEDYALLIGSGGLFLILATVMFLTRKIDWYQINNS